MTPFKKSGGFKKPFQKGSFGRHDKNGGRSDLHPATCAACGKACEVPFRPTGDRPVYCRDCFGKNMSNRGSGDAPRRNFGDNTSRKPFFHSPNNVSSRSAQDFSRQGAQTNSQDFGKLSKQLETLTVSIERLSNALETSLKAVVDAPMVAPAKRTSRKKKAS